MEKVTIQFDADLTPLREQLGQLKSSGLQELSSEATQASSSIDKLSQSAKNMPMDIVSQGLDEATQSLKENSQAITENVVKQQSMKAELRDLKNKLQELEDQGKDNTKEFEQMAIRAGQLSDQIGDTSARIRVLGDDSKYIKAVSQAIGGLASAYSVAQGASALFGAENKDVEKALLKVNAAMSIANGLQQINEALQKQSTIAVVAHSTAQKLYNYFVVEGTVATSAFRIALASTGIGLAVIVLSQLYKAYEEHNKHVKQAEEATKSYGEALKSAFSTASQEITSLELLYKTATDTNKSMVDRKKAVDELQKIYPSYFANIKDEAILNGKAKESYDNLNGAILDNARAKAYTQMLNEKVLAQEIEIEKYRKATADAQKKMADMDTWTDEQKGTLQAQGAYAGYQKTIADGNKKIAELTKKYADENKDLLDQVLLYTNKASTYIKDKDKENTASITKNQKDITDKILESYYIKVNTAKQALDATEKGTIAELEANINLANAQAELAIKAVEISTDSELLKKSKIETINADMYASIKSMMQNYDKAQEGIQNKQIEDAKNASDKITKTKEKETKDAEDARKAEYERISAWYKKVMAEEEKRQQQIKENKKRAEQEAIDSAQTIANAEFEIAKNTRDAKLQAEIDALEARKDKELSNKNLTEAQKQAIQRKYDKLEADVKTKAWEADQKAKKEQAIINGALAITKIWADVGGNYVLGAILTAASVISTAAQVRVIDSQPVPKFATGKNLDGYEGMAIIGEAGRELRIDSDGSAKMYNRATIDHVKADSVILPNRLTEALLKSNIPAMNLRNMNAVTKQNVTAQLDIDYAKLARTISKEMKDSQKVSVNIDEKGFETRILNGISERRIMDNRYKL